MNQLTNWIKSHQVIAFFVITFAITGGLGFTYGAVMTQGQFLLAPLMFVATCGPALAALLLLFPYELWSVHRGYQAWTTLVRKKDEVSSAPWKKIWWWIPLSYVIVIAGIACYTFIQQIL